MSITEEQLKDIYKLFNENFFENKLCALEMNIINTSRKFIHYTSRGIKNENCIEVTITTGTLNTYLETAALLILHEMVHIYNDLILNIADTSSKNSYHNKLFKQEAERHGLICRKTEKYGWAQTELTITAKNVLLSYRQQTNV